MELTPDERAEYERLRRKMLQPGWSGSTTWDKKKLAIQHPTGYIVFYIYTDGWCAAERLEALVKMLNDHDPTGQEYASHLDPISKG